MTVCKLKARAKDKDEINNKHKSKSTNDKTTIRALKLFRISFLKKIKINPNNNIFLQKGFGYVEILGKVLHFLIQKTVGAKKVSRCHSGFKAS